MTAQRLVENCVLTNQTAVVDEMLNKHLLPEEYIYPFLGDVMEWWLIDSWLAERLKREGEVIIEEYGHICTVRVVDFGCLQSQQCAKNLCRLSVKCFHIIKRFYI